MVKILLLLAAFLVHGSVFAHNGGRDAKGCHMQKNVGRHCHGENEGKYIPETEEKRLARLHKSVCSGIDKPRFDFYGKPCRNRG